MAYAADITIFGALATFLYPYLAHAIFGLDPVRVGLFLGTAVHDTSQVVASGLIFDQAFPTTAALSGADVAVIIKMVRNVFMAAVVPLMAYRYARVRARQSGSKVDVVKLLPLFVLGAPDGHVRSGRRRAVGGSPSAWEAEGWKALVAAVKAQPSTAAGGPGGRRPQHQLRSCAASIRPSRGARRPVSSSRVARAMPAR